MILLEELKILDSSQLQPGEAFISQNSDSFMVVSFANEKVQLCLTGSSAFKTRKFLAEKAIYFGKTQILVEPKTARWISRTVEPESIPAGALAIADGELLVATKDVDESIFYCKVKKSTQQLDSYQGVYFTKWRVTQGEIVIAEIDTSN